MAISLTNLTATEAVALLRRGEVSPLELVDAAATRIEAVEPRAEHALLGAAALLEQETGLAGQVPRDPA